MEPWTTTVSARSPARPASACAWTCARGQVAWVDDGGSLAAQPGDRQRLREGRRAADGRGGNILGAAQLGLSLPIFGVEQPTLALDVTTGAGGGQQLAISLPDSPPSTTS